MELKVVGPSSRKEPRRPQQPFESLQVYYQSVCEKQREASLRNTSLLQDLSSLRQKVQLLQKTAAERVNRYTSLKWRYEAFVNSQYTQWMNIVSQQSSATTTRRHDDRQPDPLITTTTTRTQLPRPPLSHGTPLAPTAPVALSMPHPLMTHAVGGHQSQVLKQYLPSQLNVSTPPASSPQPVVSSHLEREAGHGQYIPAEKLTARVMQTSPVEHTTIKNVDSSRRATGGRSEQTLAVGELEGKIELQHPKTQSTRPEKRKEELALSSLSLSPSSSPSPSPSLSVDISPAGCVPVADSALAAVKSTPVEHTRKSNMVSNGRSVPRTQISSKHSQQPTKTHLTSASHISHPPPPTSQPLASCPPPPSHLTPPPASHPTPPPASHLTSPPASHLTPPPPSHLPPLVNKIEVSSSLSESLSALSAAAQPCVNGVSRVGETGDREMNSVSDSETNLSATEEDPPLLPSNKDNLDDISVNKEDQTTLSATEEDPANLSDNEEDLDDLSVTKEDLVSQSADEEDPANLAANEGDHDSTAVTAIINLISALNKHLDGDAESADLMYTLPNASDNMKSQINNSQVLVSNLTKTAVSGQDLSTWEPGAVSMVLLQQLSQLTSSVGGLLPRQLLNESAPLLTSNNKLICHLTPPWSLVWPALLEHITLLYFYGRTTTELAATFTPPLVASGKPTHREKACLQLLSLLQAQVKSTPPSAGAVMKRESLSLSEDISSPLSLEEGAEIAKEQHENGKLEMATTVFGGEDDDESQHSSLLSEGSAIAEIEKELQAVVSQGGADGGERGGGGEWGKQLHPSSMATFTTPPLYFDPSDVSSDDQSDSAAPQSSTGYIPTGWEQQRSSLVTSQASNQSSLKRRLGLLGDSDSDFSDLDDNLLPPTTPLNKNLMGKKDGRHINSKGLGEELEQDDFDFYG